MTYPYSLLTSLENEAFQESYGWYPNVNREPCYAENDILSRILKVEVPYEGECFIPVLGFQDTLKVLQEWIALAEPIESIKLSYPLFVGGADSKKTANSIIQSINRCNRTLRLTNIKTSKGLDYYGGNGLIFDEHWNPLMLCGFNIEINRNQGVINVNNPVCYIDTNVFINNDILSKGIIKKVIPILSKYRVSSPSYFTTSSNEVVIPPVFDSVPITVCSIDKYFEIPCKPINVENLDASIWEFLSNSISNII